MNELSNPCLSVTLLGTAAALPDEGHEHVYMVVNGPDGAVLIDCASSPLPRLQRAGVTPEHVRAVVLTHFHPDHVYGLPLFLLQAWLRKRRDSLHLIGLRSVLERAEAMMALYEWQTWNNFYPVVFSAVDRDGGTPAGAAPVFETGDFSLYAAATQHSVPSQAIKVVARRSGRSLVYSSDTEPCQAVVELARGADVLIHEATGAWPGHSSPAAAGSIARQAGVGRLLLVHYPVTAEPQDWLAQARQTFDGPAEMAHDFQVVTLST